MKTVLNPVYADCGVLIKKPKELGFLGTASVLWNLAALAWKTAWLKRLPILCRRPPISHWPPLQLLAAYLNHNKQSIQSYQEAVHSNHPHSSSCLLHPTRDNSLKCLDWSSVVTWKPSYGTASLKSWFLYLTTYYVHSLPLRHIHVRSSPTHPREFTQMSLIILNNFKGSMSSCNLCEFF